MIIVVMGVSGCGKSTIGMALATALGWDFQEGDVLHPATNVAKMRSGTPLTDEDRWPWLARIAAWMHDQDANEKDGVVTCSALRRSYRDRLRGAAQNVRFAWIDVSRSELERRTAQREHFMPAALLHSQLQTLEIPTVDEGAFTVDGEAGIAAMIAEIRRSFLK